MKSQSIIFEKGKKNSIASEVSRRIAAPSKTHFRHNNFNIPRTSSISSSKITATFPTDNCLSENKKEKKRINYLDHQFPLVSTRDARLLNHRDDLDLVQNAARTFSSRKCDVHHSKNRTSPKPLSVKG